MEPRTTRIEMYENPLFKNVKPNKETKEDQEPLIKKTKEQGPLIKPQQRNIINSKQNRNSWIVERQPRNIINRKQNRNSWIESSPKDLDEISVSKPWRQIRWFGLALSVIGGIFSAGISIHTRGRASFWGELLKAIALATNGLIILFDSETFKGFELKFQYGITKLGGLLIAMTVAIGIIIGDPEGFYKIEPKI